MNVLLDECLPKRFGRSLVGHQVKSTRQMNWQGLSNGRLLAVAHPHFDVFITVDKNLVHQQNLGEVRLAIIVLRARSNKIEDLAPLVPDLLAALPNLTPGQIVALEKS